MDLQTLIYLTISKYLVTGTAGFIGFHLANDLLENGNEVVELDNINNYYNVGLKYARLGEAEMKGIKLTGTCLLRVVSIQGTVSSG